MRIRALAGPVVVVALLANTPQLALGQTGERSISGGGVSVTFSARPDTEIQSDQLMEFLAKNLSVRFTDMRPLSVTLRLQTISREEGVIGKWESEAVKVEAGTTYSGETWIPNAGGGVRAAPGFGDRRKIGFLGFGVWEDVREAWDARECQRATHAVQISLWSDGRLFWEPNKPIDFVCLTVEG